MLVDLFIDIEYFLEQTYLSKKRNQTKKTTTLLKRTNKQTWNGNGTTIRPNTVTLKCRQTERVFIIFW